MNTNTKIFLSVVAAVIVLSGALIFFASKDSNSGELSTGNNNGSVAGASTNKDETATAEYKERLAKFLTEKGMVLYGAYWCPHCKDQKALFGDALQYIDYVECDAKGPNANPDECAAQGIESYPTWIYQGQKYTGYKSLSQLAEIVGFANE